MKIYFGVGSKIGHPRLLQLKDSDVLESFADPLPDKWHGGFFNSVYLDSGAYASWKRGIKIDEAEYFDYALSRDYSGVATDLKIEGDNTDDTIERTLKWEKFGINAIPAFHQGEDFKVFDFMATNFKTVALGTTTKSSSSKEALEWLKACFERIVDSEGHTKVKIHGYRLINRCSMFPFYSVDSVNWSLSGPRNPHGPSSIAKALPWLRTDEIMDLVLLKYKRMQRCVKMQAE